MQIKYLKNAPNALEGEVKDIPDAQAKVLILTGYAKEHKARAKTDKSGDQTDLLTPETEIKTDTDSE